MTGICKRKPSMEDSSKSLREKHSIASVKIKIAHQGHGKSQTSLPPTLRWVVIKQILKKKKKNL
jgi:hypothetical protein